jgi:hypothetical protein
MGEKTRVSLANLHSSKQGCWGVQGTQAELNVRLFERRNPTLDVVLITTVVVRRARFGKGSNAMFPCFAC